MTESPLARFARPIDGFLPRLMALVVAFAVVACAGMAMAQQRGDLIGQQRRVVESTSMQVDALADRIEAKANDDAGLTEIRSKLDEQSDKLAKIGDALKPRLSEIDARLEQLGAPPEEGQPAEPEVVMNDRRTLHAEKAQINSLIGEADSLSVRISHLVERVGEKRREFFARTLSKRYQLDFSLVGEVIDELGAEMKGLYATFASWGRYVVTSKPKVAAFSSFLALVLAIVMIVGGRRLFGTLIEADPEEENPSYLSRLSVAFWSTFLPTAAVTVFLGTVYLLYESYGVFRDDIGQIVGQLFGVIALFFFISRLVRATLSPNLPNWRVIPIESRAARTLVWLVTLTAAIKGLDYLLGTINEVVSAPLSVTVGNSLAATVAIGILVILIGLVRPFPPAGDEPEGEPRRWPTWFRYLLFAAGAATIAASLLGYIGLGRFLAQQIVVTGAILVTMYIGFLSANALAGENAFAQSALGRRLTARTPLGEGTLDQLGLVTSIAINILVVVWGVPLILLQWGFQWGDITGWIVGIASDITVGSFSFSIVGILTGVLVFVLGYFVTRWFQAWIDGSVLARGRVDTGVRNSIRTAVGYAGVAIAALIGIAAAGIDLSNLALVAGALSLGIGFGLQNIVSNFVSGLILLAERPFKAGDWIVAGQVSGTVKKISVRATEIETFQRQTVILPNSELINAAVGNWTHKNSLGRIDVAVRVAYGTDARQAHEILLDIARNHPLVLKNPEPFVLFVEFGEYSMNFEVRVYLADILMQLDVMNDIRFAVVDAFAKEGIRIPYPQRDIHLVSDALTPADGRPGPSDGGRDDDERGAQSASRRRRSRSPDPE